MIFVWFIYGLAFFALGLVIVVYPKKGSIFKLANHIWLIAGFGILHGINEWLDMFIDLEDLFPPDILKVIRLITLVGSFLFLVRFGTKIIAEANKQLRLIKTLPVVLFAVWLTIFLLSDDRLLFGDIFGRYLLCTSGSFLTAVALFMQVPQFKQTKSNSIIRNLRISAVAFILYAVFAGLIVKKAPFPPASLINYDVFKSLTGGIPVQIFRAVCAVVLACSTTYILSVFRWETQKALSESELRFNRIASEAPVILFIANSNCIITFIEGKGLEVLGIKSSEVAGRPVAEVFSEASQMAENSRRALAGEEFVSIVTIGEFLFETYYGPLRDDDDEIAGLLGVAVDITARKKIQAELDKYRNEMLKTRQMASLGAMSSQMAQELSEPLAVARVFLQRLQTDLSNMTNSDNILRKLKDSLGEVTKAAAIIDRFYANAHITPKPQAEPIDLYQTVKRIVAVFAESAQRAKLQIITTGMDVVPCMRISLRELEQVFFILIQNAIEAADGYSMRELIITCKIDRDAVVLSFSDTCGGMPPEKLKEIFEPYSSTRVDSGSLGLSLAVIKRIVCSYGGDIQAESQPGRGTTFHVRLPIESVH